ncbi:uncharacterized protein BCR38DRAFT_454214 [Pseudomassariella vexata]|uniref:Uncharacterized protein n=1 Tax=Pseudomassariella vexata TaxID=1141098 RepID=A0A1Y2EJP6_9PEZI|nr:uncharacterized protein BCR38DRAFT_454214 [Pseudomassariella vexata]ORY71771.1 hypothetical protein BCR38DRAFT_454214 [Pseudomassariella vexata]
MRLLPAATLTHVGPSDSLASSPARQPPSLDDDNSTDDEFDMPLLERNPLTYFLTPPDPLNEEPEFEFDFDAGIEDSNHPPEIVRSISPSTLDGLKRYKPKNKTECAIVDDGDMDIDDDDDDDEDYIRFTPHNSLNKGGFPFDLPDVGFDRPKPAGVTQTRTTEALLSPSAFHIGSPRGRPAKRFSPPPPPLPPSSTAYYPPHRRPAFPRGRTRSAPLLRRHHSWREPSPDVWAIEEEPEKETMSEMGFSAEDLLHYDRDKTMPIDIPAAKPKKKVRFILPVDTD